VPPISGSIAADSRPAEVAALGGWQQIGQQTNLGSPGWLGRKPGRRRCGLDQRRPFCSQHPMRVRTVAGWREMS